MKKNITGFLYFYIHFVVEVICFYFLSSVIGDNTVLWLVPFVYDALAFVPQALIGHLSDKFARIPFGLIGMGLMAVAVLLLFLTPSLSVFVSVIILCLGNACVHVAGAEVTLRSSNGKIAPSAIFVAGGSFGVITGKLLAGVAPFWFILILAATSIPFILFAEKYRRQSETLKNPCKNFDYANKNLPIYLVIIAAVLVVIIRGYMGYGIPTAWNKTTLQTVALFSFMGVGKALGGILCDKIGIKKTAIISVIGALPFLLFGDNLMFVSLIGVMLFSMTMSITLALLVSVLKRSPGFAFGLTTTGLFLGTAPIFFIKLESQLANYLVIIISTIICYLILMKIIKQEKGIKNEKNK
jgi:MFS family permease